MFNENWMGWWMDRNIIFGMCLLFILSSVFWKRDTIINKPNTLGKNIFSQWNTNGILAENRTNFYSCTLTHMFRIAWMAFLVLKSFYFLWWKEYDVTFLLMKINFLDLIVFNLK